MTRPGNYANLTQFALDQQNQVDPREVARDTELVVVKILHGQAQIVARGRKVSCDGHILVLAPRLEEHDKAGGVPIIGSARAAIEKGDRPTQEVRLVGLRVLDGRKYAEWQVRRSGGRRIKDL